METDNDILEWYEIAAARNEDGEQIKMFSHTNPPHKLYVDNGHGWSFNQIRCHNDPFAGAYQSTHRLCLWCAIAAGIEIKKEKGL